MSLQCASPDDVQHSSKYPSVTVHLHNCSLFALASPEIEILGFIVTFGETDNVVRSQRLH